MISKEDVCLHWVCSWDAVQGPETWEPHSIQLYMKVPGNTESEHWVNKHPGSVWAELRTTIRKLQRLQLLASYEKKNSCDESTQAHRFTCCYGDVGSSALWPHDEGLVQAHEEAILFTLAREFVVVLPLVIWLSNSQVDRVGSIGRKHERQNVH